MPTFLTVGNRTVGGMRGRRIWGAQTLAHRDEFEALGLSRHRQVEGWLPE
jgi:hypothetical protein